MCLLYFSNKKDKVIANRLFRRISRLKLKKGEETLNSIREVSDTWNFDSDGFAYYFPKQYYNYLLNLGYSQEEEQKSDEALLPSQREDTAFLRGTQNLLSV